MNRPMTLHFDNPVNAAIEAKGICRDFKIMLVRLVLWATGCRALVRCASAEKVIIEIGLSTTTKKQPVHFAILCQVVCDWLTGQCTNRMVRRIRKKVLGLGQTVDLPLQAPNVPGERAASSRSARPGG